MSSKQDIIATLDQAFGLELSKRTINFKDEFMVAPQVPQGKSVWATWVKDGLFEPHHVMWAFKDTNPKEWLAIRVYVPHEDFSFSQVRPEVEDARTFYFNLQSERDRALLRQLETELKEYLSK